MVGGFSFNINSKNYKIDFTIMRKITVIIGDSATGKSEICRIINDEKLTGRSVINCKYPVRTLDDSLISVIHNNIANIFMKYPEHKTDKKQSQLVAIEIKSVLQILGISEGLYFIDEDVQQINTKELSAFFKYAEGFFVIITRNLISYVPYSMKSVFNMKASGKYHSLVPKFKEYLQIRDYYDVVLTEDSKSGYEFFSKFYKDSVCISAKTNTKIHDEFEKIQDNVSVLVIADGAAFGGFLQPLLDIIDSKRCVNIFLPESFEYLLLDAFFKDKCSKELSNTEIFADDSYYSWEKYYTELLINLTKGYTNEYSKKKLIECFYLPCCYFRKGKNEKIYNCNIKQSDNKLKMILNKYLQKNSSTREMQLF